MVKVYKIKDKLAIYLPFDTVKDLDLKEGDEVDFFKFKQSSYIFAKKSDIMNLILGGSQTQAPSKQSARMPEGGEQISEEEVIVLKKLDSLRYNMRTKANIIKMLGADEKTVLKGLMKKKAVSLFAKDKSKEPLFSISSSIYDRYLMRKKVGQQQPAAKAMPEPKMSGNYQKQQTANLPNIENDNVKKLEKEGFIVLQYEAEASALSFALEQSIRRGMVLGTRSFNKKFYIILRSYFDRHGSKILKALKDGEMKVSQIAKEVEIDEDGARAILYLLAESGDVSEKKKDLFTIA